MKTSSPFRVGAFTLLLSAIALPIGILAQGSTTNNNPQAQAIQLQNVNYFNKIDINDDVETNLGNQDANPPPQVQQQRTNGSVFGSEDNTPPKTTGCKDCDAVKKAITASHASSGSHRGSSFSMKKWSKRFLAKTRIKMQRTFAHHKKIKSSYEVCFNWH